MTIEQLLKRTDLLVDGWVLVAKKPPFTWASEAEIVQMTDSFEIPQSVLDNGFQYVLECDEIVKLLAFLDTKKIGQRGRAEFIIHYATYDCAPEWINDVPNS